MSLVNQGKMNHICGIILVKYLRVNSPLQAAYDVRINFLAIKIIALKIVTIIKNLMIREIFERWAQVKQ